MKALIKFLLVLIVAAVGLGCSCIEPLPPVERLSQASAVFVGTVTKRDESGETRVCDFAVSEVFKGGIKAKVRVSTPKEGSICGVYFVEGEKYLVFAHGPIDRLSTTLCSANRGASSELGRKEIAALRSAAKSR